MTAWTELVRGPLRATAAVWAQRGLPTPTLEGKLLRPSAALQALGARKLPGVGDPFWSGALALEMVHEASLLHDDILDDAAERRGRPTAHAADGMARALVGGDHLLTAAYRVAAEVRAPAFLPAFVRAVERTVAGEIRQGRTAGAPLTFDEYRAIIEGKSGELFGAALALAAAVRGEPVEPSVALGRRIGALYQMVDDFLDYCPSGAHGKPAFQDLRQAKWTFVALELDEGLDGARARWLADASAFGRSLVEDRGAGSVLGRALARLEVEAGAVTADVRAPALQAMVEAWVGTARRALEREETWAHAGALALAVGGEERWAGYFAHHSRSFRFASRLFPADARRMVEGVYAFCRFTDDLVDEASVPAPLARQRLEAWGRLAWSAYEGHDTGVPLADQVMGSMRRRGVPWHYVEELLAGVAMDLEPVRFQTTAELETYTYRVASVVGGWLTELFGVRDPRVLDRAFHLGHAMQLTNILRDVGEDWRRGRLYLPLDLLERAGLEEDDVRRLADEGRVPPGWPALMEDLMASADRSYDLAFEALPELPDFYQRPVAVAARVYQGIHDMIRRNGYDNGTRRAYTSRIAKLRLAGAGLLDLRRARAAARSRYLAPTPLPQPFSPSSPS